MAFLIVTLSASQRDLIEGVSEVYHKTATLLAVLRILLKHYPEQILLPFCFTRTVESLS
jgi:hypothetical protein